MATVIERVRAGALLLDMSVPGWAEKIDREELNLGSCTDCLLGQLFKKYDEGVKQLGLNRSQRDGFNYGFDVMAVDRGIVIPHAEILASIEELASAWLAEIALRLGTPEAEEARVEAQPVDTGEVWGAL